MKGKHYYKWLANNGPVYGVGTYAPPGEWQPRFEGELAEYKRGYHVLTAEQVALWMGDSLIRVDAQNVAIMNTENTLCRTWREIRRLRWTQKDMLDFAEFCMARAAAAAHADRNDAVADRYSTDAARDANRARLYPANQDAIYAARAVRGAGDAARAAARYSTHELQAQREWIESRIGERLT